MTLCTNFTEEASESDFERPRRCRPRARRRSVPRALLALPLLAILCAACGGPPARDWTSRSGLLNLFPEDSRLSDQVGDAFDQGGLDQAMQVFREAHCEREPPPYYRVAPQRLTGAQLEKRADKVIETGFTYGGRPPFRVTAPVDWPADPYDDRSWRFWLNSLEPIDDVLAAYAETGSYRYLHFAESVGRDWIRQHSLSDRSNPFAWYDMAVGLRALKLAYLTDAAARQEETSSQALAELLWGCWEHGWQLAQERNFNDATNHGIYQSAGLLALARSLPELRGASAWERLAEERLVSMFGKSFSEEGVHLEHSPGYHLAMLRLLVAMLESGLLDDPSLRSLRAQAEEALAWLVAPGGELPRLGDTDLHRVAGAEVGFPASEIAPGLAYVLTKGEHGAPPPQTYRVFPTAGYAVFRGRWPAPGDDWADLPYLILAAGFHSRTHKHADDLTFEWWDAGHSIIVDSGRFGYYYDDPRRIYCESTRAHNTVEIDGRDYSRRRSEAFGSALRGWGEGDGLSFVSAEIERAGGVSQQRTLVWKPGYWLVVLDELQSERPHDYTQWFHFHPTLDLGLTGQLATIELDESRALYVRPLAQASPLRAEAVRGRETPRMQGWTSLRHRTMEPSYALGYSTRDTNVVFATLLHVGTSPPEQPGKAEQVRVDPHRIRIAWQGQSRTEGFVLERGVEHATIRCLDAGSQEGDPDS